MFGRDLEALLGLYRSVAIYPLGFVEWDTH